MAKIKFYLDTRSSKGEKPSPLKLAVTHNRSTAYVPLNVHLTPEQWDSKKNRVRTHDNITAINSLLTMRKSEYDAALLRLSCNENITHLTAVQLRDKLVCMLNPEIAQARANENTFEQCFLRFANHKTKRTQEIYMATYKRLGNFLGKKFKSLTFEDINKEWLQNFDDFLAMTAPSANARNIHLRNIRAVFNDAIDNEITTNYPFRRFKIKPEPTRKRNLSVEAIRKIFNAERLEPWQVKYRDFFKLSFMLIGINVIDLCNLQTYENGRVEYIRAKTHKPYSIKVETEANEIIQKYSGEKHLLNYLDTYKNYRSFYMNMCNGLKAIKQRLNDIDDGVTIKELTSYWARHSWATIAAYLDIPKDTIAAALGHGGNTVTDIYIEFDMRKVDEANRKVLDYVLYDKT